MRVFVSGGSGFIGAALVRELLTAGHEVRVLDDHSRGYPARLEGLQGALELISGDVRDPCAVRAAAEGCEFLWHLAYINGTRFFYERPDEVLEVGVKGALNTIEAALDAGVRRYILASTSEVYNQPSQVPTPEGERIMIPDIRNPRFSYGGGKIASELLALHYGGHRGLEVVIFRPHNIYGPEMGFEHVIPEIVQRIIKLSGGLKEKRIKLPIQGAGQETRAFCYIDDGARGALIAGEQGQPGEIYHLGVQEETRIIDLILGIGEVLGVELEIQAGPLMKGGTLRRCPDIRKLCALGYEPQISLKEGLRRSVEWYAQRSQVVEWR